MPIEQINNGIRFRFAFQKADGTGGKTGLTDLRINVRGPSSTILTGFVTTLTEVDATNFPGLYEYVLSGASVTVEGEYTAVAKTADATVVSQTEWSQWTVGRAGIENIDAAITSRLAPTTAGRTLNVSAGGVGDAHVLTIADGAIADTTFAPDALDATAELSTDAIDDIVAAVWAATTRTLTAGTNIVLAKGTGITGLNDIAATDVWAAGTRTLTSGANIALAKGTGLTGLNDITAASVWGVARSGNQTSGTFGQFIDAAISGVSTGGVSAAAIAAEVWSTTTRTLTAGTNIVLAKGVGITGLNDLSASQVNAEADAALADVGLTTTITGRIDVAVSTRLATVGYTAPDNTGIAAILDDTGTSGVVVAAGSKTGYALTSGERDSIAAAIFAFVTEGTTTFVQAVRGWSAALLGKASGLDVNAPKYRDLADTKDRISATTDDDGNRLTVTRDLS